MRVTALLMIVLLAIGCGRGKSDSAATTGLPQPNLSSLTANEPPRDPNEILVDVNGKTLTRGEANDQAEQRLPGLRGNIPPTKRKALRARVLRMVVEQFVIRTLLLDEAERIELTVSEEDKTEAFDKIREQLPEGQTLEEIMRTSPMGEDKMREEVMIGLRINKLLSLNITNEFVVTDEELDTYIEENQERLQLPETAGAKHILFAVTPEDDDAAKAEKKALAERVRQELLDGADFAAAAAEYSSCPSKEKGGDLGTFRKGQMVPEFEKAAFTQEVDAIGPIVETKFGYHIIQVSKHDEAGQVPREEVAERLKGDKERAARTVYIDGLRAKADVKLMINP